MDLNEIAIFLKVIQLGSFSKAAAALGLPNSTVSAKVSSLEKRLGLNLIQRTTRKLSVTPVGEAYARRCRVGLQELEVAEQEIARTGDEPYGRLRLTAPVELGNSVLPDLLIAFATKYPRIEVDVLLSDLQVDLIGEGIDLALRAGSLKDSSMIARRIAEVGFELYASPRYLKEFGVPRRPKDLEKLGLIQRTPVGPGPLHLVNGRESASLNLAARFAANDLHLIKNFSVRGAGVALLPTFFCQAEIESRRLVRVLPGWTSRRSPLQFVYPAQKYVPSRVTAFVHMATERLRTLLIT